MKEIYKYSLEKVSSTTNIELPVGSQVLDCQIDNKTGTPCIWVLLNPNESVYESRYFQLIMTGEEIIGDMDNKKYIATFQKDRFVGHVFEITKLNKLNKNENKN